MLDKLLLEPPDRVRQPQCSIADVRGFGFAGKGENSSAEAPMRR
jgi:hypothetical protein